MGGGFNTTLNGAISGTGTLTLPSAYTSTVTMSGSSSNTYTGTTSVDGGTLVLSKTGGDVAIPGQLDIGNFTAMPATVRLNAHEQISHAPGNAVRVRSEGLLDLNGHTETIARLLLEEDSNVTTGSGKLIVGESIQRFLQGIGLYTITGNVDLNGGQPSIGSGVVIDGVISNGGVKFEGSVGTVFLRGPANTYAGPTVVNGSVSLNKSGVDGGFRGDVTVRGNVERALVSLSANEQILAAAGNEVFLSHGDLNLNAFSETIQDITLKDGRVFGAGTLTVLGTISALFDENSISVPLNLAGTRTFNSLSVLALTGVVSNGSIVKTGPGILSLGNAGNTYSGGTFINEGFVRAETDGNLGAAGAAIHFDGGLLRVGHPAFSSTSRSMIWGPNGGGFDIAGTTLVFTLSTQSLSGAGPFMKLGLGKLVLLAPQSYNGGTTVAAGTLEGNTQSLQGNIVNNATLAFNQASDGTYAGNLSGSADWSSSERARFNSLATTRTRVRQPLTRAHLRPQAAAQLAICQPSRLLTRPASYSISPTAMKRSARWLVAARRAATSSLAAEISPPAATILIRRTPASSAARAL